MAPRLTALMVMKVAVWLPLYPREEGAVDPQILPDIISNNCLMCLGLWTERTCPAVLMYTKVSQKP